MADFILGPDHLAESSAVGRTGARESTRERCTDTSALARAANNALLTLASRGSMIFVGIVVTFIGARLLTQLDRNTEVTAELAKNVAVISTTVTDMVERVRGLEQREREMRK